MSDDQTQQPEAPEQPQAPAQQPELTIVDLQNLRAIFDVAASRGAFKAAEMEAIGSQYNKLSRFLDVVAPPQQPAQQPADQQPAA